MEEQDDPLMTLLRLALAQNELGVDPERWRRAVGNAARQRAASHTVVGLRDAIRRFGEESYINNPDRAMTRLQEVLNVTLDPERVDEGRLQACSILLCEEDALSPSGVIQGLLRFDDATTIHECRGGGRIDPLDVASVMTEYLYREADFLAISYAHHPYDEQDNWGMNESDFAEIRQWLAGRSKTLYVWIDKVRSQARGLQWIPSCSLIYIAFEGLQLASAAQDPERTNRLWIVTERDMIQARESVTAQEVPALAAYAVLCRNANRGNYDNCPYHQPQQSKVEEFLEWARRLMGKLFHGALNWGDLEDDDAKFKHAAITVICNFTVLKQFLVSTRLMRRDHLLIGYGPLTSLDLDRSDFWPETEPRSNQAVEDVDLALENAMNYYLAYEKFIGGFSGIRGSTFFIGRIRGESTRVHGDWFRVEFIEGRVTSAEFGTNIFENAFQANQAEAETNAFLINDQWQLRISFESIDSDEAARSVTESTRGACIVRAGHLYTY